MSLRMRVVIGEEEYWSVGVLECWKRLRHHYSISPSPALRHSEEFLPDPQLRVLGKEDFRDKHLVWCELARRDCLGVLDPLLRIDQNCGRLVRDSVVVGPLGEDVSRGIHQVNFDSLIAGKVERHRALGQICQRNFHSKLTNLRQLYRLWCDLEI